MRLPSLFALASSIILLTPATAQEPPRRYDAGEPETIRFGDGDKINGTLRMHIDQTLDYYRNEIGVDISKLLKHRELFDRRAREYTFPKGSGTEGTVSWDLPEERDRKSDSLVPYEQHMTVTIQITYM